MDNLNNKVMVIGASENPSRYSNIVTKRLLEKGYEIIALGNKEGNINGIKIIADLPTTDNIHTVTLYINPSLQKLYYDYILDLNPKRIIFNPGTENPELLKLCSEKGIESIEACSLVMLSTGVF